MLKKIIFLGFTDSSEFDTFLSEIVLKIQLMLVIIRVQNSTFSQRCFNALIVSHAYQ